eukprot:CAMPEP_0201284282 /NCGR_PEP_ID=MMETSP1317-20130820/69085_1 /ASSEMBLY_ACC=CAM_ASM_000770 /TAXON_ID=187299 /ORGANISM="Undescribed Undescribed, Strain Undescribed" /LENGTH=314 /DNA_ID=CAMNT_0047603813 /DNA_START=204 /DNA_END=1148 /DNA_ORIENTATION=+
MIIRLNDKPIGTIGGGLVEAQVIKESHEIFMAEGARIKCFELTEDMDMACGGKLNILIELIKAVPKNIQFFESLFDTIRKGQKSFHIVFLGKKNENIQEIEHYLVLENGSVCGKVKSFSSSCIEVIKSKINEEKNRYAAVFSVSDLQFFVEPIFIQKTVFIFGAGHISKNLAMLTQSIDFKTIVLDDREEFANRKRFKQAKKIIVLDKFENAFEKLFIDNDSYLVIVTRGHSYDKTVLEQALKTNAAYIGMIGSRKKRNAIYKALLNSGFTQKDLDRVHSPIGLKIMAETSSEIAVSIAAELIEVRARLHKTPV